MKEIRGRLSERIMRTPSVESYRFVLPERLSFVPGQFAQLVFDEGNRENRDLNKYLSLSAAPTKEYIEVTKRLSDSAFSKRLRGLQGGDEVLFRAPMGTCTFRDEDQKIAFLIGGIGITPVMAIIEYIMDRNLPTDVCLVYSNRTDEDIAFRPKLDYWQSVNRRFRVSYTVTDCQPKDATCAFGVINTAMVKARVCDWHDRLFFVFGPPRMVAAMNGVCAEIGVPPDKVKSENFVGY